MIEHVFSVLCSGTSIDAETNAVSLFKVLEQLTVYTDSADPVRLAIHYEILSLWTRQSPDAPCQGKARVVFCNPDNLQRQIAEMTIDLSQAMNYRSRLISDGIELTGPGKYLFVIELQEEGQADWQKVASIPLLVSYQPATQA